MGAFCSWATPCSLGLACAGSAHCITAQARNTMCIRHTAQEWGDAFSLLRWKRASEHCGWTANPPLADKHAGNPLMFLSPWSRNPRRGHEDSEESSVLDLAGPGCSLRTLRSRQ